MVFIWSNFVWKWLRYCELCMITFFPKWMAEWLKFVQRWHCNLRVVGSNPNWGNNFFLNPFLFLFLIGKLQWNLVKFGGSFPEVRNLAIFHWRCINGCDKYWVAILIWRFKILVLYQYAQSIHHWKGIATALLMVLISSHFIKKWPRYLELFTEISLQM